MSHGGKRNLFSGLGLTSCTLQHRSTNHAPIQDSDFNFRIAIGTTKCTIAELVQQIVFCLSSSSAHGLCRELHELVTNNRRTELKRSSPANYAARLSVLYKMASFKFSLDFEGISGGRSPRLHWVLEEWVLTFESLPIQVKKKI